jgi:hypothetical protein
VDLWIVNDFTGVQSGTQSNPYSVTTAQEYDTLIASLLYDENGWFRRGLNLNFGDGDFFTAGVYEWGYLATPKNPRLGPDWQVRGSGHTTLNLDPNSIPDENINDWPLHLFLGASQWMQYLWTPGREQAWIDLTPEDLWSTLSNRQLVKDITLNFNYSKLIDRWRAHGKALKISGGLLQGHGGAFEDVTVRDFGAYHVVDQDGKIVGAGAESFPLIIAGAVDGFDRNKLARLDPAKYIFDSHLPKEQCAHHTGCKFEQFNEADSNDQVSLCVITTSIGQPSLPATSAGDDTAPYVHHLRKWAYQTHNPIGDFPNARADRNQLQAFTIYQTLAAEVAYNGGSNMQAGYYSDFYVSANVDVHDNDWKRVIRGGVWLLSPVGPDYAHFTSRGHSFRRNKITLLPLPNGAEWNGGVLLIKFDAEGATRVLTDITIGDDNQISMAEGVGQGYAINATNADHLTIGKNNFGKLPIRLTNCTNVKKPLNWFQKILKFLHIIK